MKRDEDRRDDDKARKPLALARKALFKVIPYGAQLITSAAAYSLGITATQVVGYCLRISCCTPVLGPCLGILGVGFASTLAGQASLHTQKLLQVGGNPWQPKWWDPIDVDDALLDAVIGIIIFKGTGGLFRSLLPSDLTAPGALAFESIPARSEEYARPAVKRELARIFRRDGCHHCGSRKGPVVGDHMPPNKLAYSGYGSQVAACVSDLPLIRMLAGKAGRTCQRFYPQCQRCSVKQAAALRHNKRVLVLHTHGPRYRTEYLTGVFVGLRHNVPPFQPSSGGSGGSSKQRPHTWSALAMTPAASALAAAALAPASVPLACCTISGASSPLTMASAAATRRASSFSEIAPEDDCERQPSGLLIGGLSQAQRASGGVGGSGNVGLLQWAEEEEGVDVRGGGGGGRGGGTVGSSLDESVRASHDGRGRNPMAPADVMAAFQHWVPRHCGHGVHHVGQHMPHHGAGEHSARSSVQSVQSEQQRGGEGPGAQQYRVIAPQAPLPLAFGNDAEAEVDAEQRYARGAAHVGQLEQVAGDIKQNAQAAFERHFTAGLSL